MKKPESQKKPEKIADEQLKLLNAKIASEVKFWQKLNAIMDKHREVK